MDGGASSGARSPLPLGYYVPHTLKMEDPPPAHGHHAHMHAHAHAHAHMHALYEEVEYRRGALEPGERLDRPTVVSMGS